MRNCLHFPNRSQVAFEFTAAVIERIAGYAAVAVVDHEAEPTLSCLVSPFGVLLDGLANCMVVGYQQVSIDVDVLFVTAFDWEFIPIFIIINLLCSDVLHYRSECNTCNINLF